MASAAGVVGEVAGLTVDIGPVREQGDDGRRLELISNLSEITDATMVEK